MSRDLDPAIEAAIANESERVWLFRLTIGASTWRYAERAISTGGQPYAAKLTVLQGPRYSRSTVGGTARVAIDNVDLALSQWFADHRDDLQGARAVLAVWFAQADMEHIVFDGQITAPDTGEGALTLDLAGIDLKSAQLPKRSYQPACPWTFKSAECGYTTGGLTTCDKTFAQCTTRARTASFAGILTITRDLTEVVGGGGNSDGGAGDDGGKRSDLLLAD